MGRQGCLIAGTGKEQGKQKAECLVSHLWLSTCLLCIFNTSPKPRSSLKQWCFPLSDLMYFRCFENIALMVHTHKTLLSLCTYCLDDVVLKIEAPSVPCFLTTYRSEKHKGTVRLKHFQQLPWTCFQSSLKSC